MPPRPLHRAALAVVADAKPYGFAFRSGVCRHVGCSADAAELGFCHRCWLRYRADRLRDRAKVARLANALIGRVEIDFPNWPLPLQRQMAHNLAAELTWGESPASDKAPWHAALVATLADVVDG